MRIRRFVLLGQVSIILGGFTLCAPLAGCRHSLKPSATSLVFSELPIALNNIEFIVPIGNLNPPEHTLPTDHAYFYHHLNLNHRSLPQFDVVAPAAGTARYVRRGNDDTLEVQVTARIAYRLDHVLLDSSITQNTKISAGQRLGTTSPEAAALDLGVINDDVTIGFITPGRYSQSMLHAESPMPYFDDALKGPLYALVTGSSKDGRIDYEQPGRLIGNWFHESLTVAESPNRESGPRHLAFARDVNNGTTTKIAIGGTVAPVGVYSVAANDPDPANVTPANGAVVFHISGGNSGGTTGSLNVQMLGDNRLQVTFAGNTQIYVR